MARGQQGQAGNASVRSVYALYTRGAGHGSDRGPQTGWGGGVGKEVEVPGSEPQSVPADCV